MYGLEPKVEAEAEAKRRTFPRQVYSEGTIRQAFRQEDTVWQRSSDGGNHEERSELPKSLEPCASRAVIERPTVFLARQWLQSTHSHPLLRFCTAQSENEPEVKAAAVDIAVEEFDRCR